MCASPASYCRGEDEKLARELELGTKSLTMKMLGKMRAVK